MAAFEDGQLLSESEILQSQVTMPTEGGEERRDAGAETTDHLADYIGSKPGNSMFSANSDFWRWTGTLQLAESFSLSKNRTITRSTCANQNYVVNGLASFTGKMLSIA